eukprot:TRINITY_DN54526_c0_g1_i1.p1 TRINITY_DN54526_c0_g1~~TRINITY_DN54526_c0_g1_i1.p1  ORF type:complete len:295 (+),score=34.81 TRINITY_DN54526_c0_g1_i1:199-1083(+)
MFAQNELIEDLTTTGELEYMSLRYAGALFIAMLGSVVGGYLGWLYDDGIFVIFASLGSFIVFLCFGLAAFGIFRNWYNQFRIHMFPASLSRLTTVGLASWDLYVTIHRVYNLYNAALLFSTSDSLNYYFDVKVGRYLKDTNFFTVQANPVNRTCVQRSGIFEETFHFIVSPTDNTLRVELREQNIFADAHIATADINLTHDVLQKGFPQKKTFKLHKNEVANAGHNVANQIGNVVLSFTPGKNLPGFTADALHVKRKFAMHHLRNEREKLTKDVEEKSSNYGTWVLQADKGDAV